MPKVDDQWSVRLDWMRDAASSLETVEPEPGDDTRREMIRSLLGLYEGLTEWGNADAGEAEALRARVANPAVGDALQATVIRSHLLGYVWDAQSYAERGRYDGYQRACVLRSALQLLMDDFADRDLLGKSARDELEDVDEELRESAEDAPPPHRCEIPSWAPRTHWWWAPKRTDMSMREYRERLYAADLEGIDGSAPGAADWLRCGDRECWCFTAPA